MEDSTVVTQVTVSFLFGEFIRTVHEPAEYSRGKNY